MPDKRTYADRTEYLRRAVSERRRKLREMAREYKGNKCALCGYNKCARALGFHHRDPKKKISGYRIEGLPALGRKFKMKSKNVFCSAQIATWKYTMAYRSFLEQSRLKHEVNCWKP